MAPRETENNAYAKFWGDKESALWYVMVFSGVVNYIRVTNRAESIDAGSLIISSSFNHEFVVTYASFH